MPHFLLPLLTKVSLRKSSVFNLADPPPLPTGELFPLLYLLDSLPKPPSVPPPTPPPRPPLAGLRFRLQFLITIGASSLSCVNFLGGPSQIFTSEILRFPTLWADFALWSFLTLSVIIIFMNFSFRSPGLSNPLPPLSSRELASRIGYPTSGYHFPPFEAEFGIFLRVIIGSLLGDGLRGYRGRSRSVDC